jgi:hypothetical protein
MASAVAMLQHCNTPRPREIRLTAGYALPCYGVSAGRIAPRERVSFELDSAANK